MEMSVNLKHLKMKQNMQMQDTKKKKKKMGSDTDTVKLLQSNKLLSRTNKKKQE